MSITRKMLKGMGLSEEQQDTILEAHGEQADRLRAELKQAQEEAGRAGQLEQRVNELESQLEAAKKDGWKDKHDALKKEFEDYKKGVTAKEAKAAKEAAARVYYESKGITGKSLDIAMRGSGAEIAALELGEDGKIKDAAALEALVKGDFSGLVSTTTTTGANTANPPAVSGGKKSMDEIYKKDDKGRYVYSAAERQQALAESMAQNE